MELRIKQKDSATVVRPMGRFDARGAKSFRQSVSGLHVDRASVVIFDTSEISALCGIGLEAIFWFIRQMNANGNSFVMAGASPACRLLLERSALSKIAPMYDSIESALSQATRGVRG